MLSSMMYVIYGICTYTRKFHACWYTYLTLHYGTYIPSSLEAVLDHNHVEAKAASNGG